MSSSSSSHSYHIGECNESARLLQVACTKHTINEDPKSEAQCNIRALHRTFATYTTQHSLILPDQEYVDTLLAIQHLYDTCGQSLMDLDKHPAYVAHSPQFRLDSLFINSHSKSGATTTTTTTTTRDFKLLQYKQYTHVAMARRAVLEKLAAHERECVKTTIHSYMNHIHGMSAIVGHYAESDDLMKNATDYLATIISKTGLIDRLVHGLNKVIRRLSTLSIADLAAAEDELRVLGAHSLNNRCMSDTRLQWYLKGLTYVSDVLANIRAAPPSELLGSLASLFGVQKVVWFARGNILWTFHHVALEPNFYLMT